MSNMTLSETDKYTLFVDCASFVSPSVKPNLYKYFFSSFLPSAHGQGYVIRHAIMTTFDKLHAEFRNAICLSVTLLGLVFRFFGSWQPCSWM